MLRDVRTFDQSRPTRAAAHAEQGRTWHGGPDPGRAGAPAPEPAGIGRTVGAARSEMAGGAIWWWDMMRNQRGAQVFRITGARQSLADDVRGRQRRYIISMSVRTVSVVLAATL